jgi:predicted pyridoxine 5'-phosphate oxidase superfamily flavin-nucleotide-binding protein
MSRVYHEGERAVQTRAGVRAAATRLSAVIGETIPEQAREFVGAQPIAFVGARGDGGQIWASPLSGAPDLLRRPDSRTLHIGATPPGHDPLAEALTGRPSRETEVGLLLIDFAARRRLRVNGAIEPIADGGLIVRVQRAYWICPKYIQRCQIIAPASRTAESEPVAGLAAHPAFRTAVLTPRQRD